MSEEGKKRQPYTAIFPSEIKRQRANAGRGSSMPGEEGYRALRRAEQASSSQNSRMVSVPQAVKPKAWDSYVQRRDQMYAERSRGQQQDEMVPRRLAQTATGIAGSQARYARKSLPKSRPTPVPVRSGQFQRRRGLLWKILGLFTGLTLLALACAYALTGPAFRVEQVSVVGTHNDALAQQIQQMGMQGQNIFLIDVTGLTNRIDALPQVASADLQKQWPNQLVITVQQRVPALIWQTSYGTFSVDGQGVVITSTINQEGTSANQLMTVKDLATYHKGGKATARHIQPGDHLNAADIAFAAQVFHTLPVLTGIKTFTLLYDTTAANGGQGETESAGAFIVESQAGWVAYLGGSGDANPLYNRLVELQQILLLARQQQLNLATIDVRYGLRPVYTLK
jgi:hypothetical protein